MNLISPLFGSFRRSFQELRSLRSLLIAAMLLAIHTVLSVFISIQVTESLRISISFIANVLTACLFGPVVGLLNAALGDILQFLIKPVGGYYFGWTLNAALAGLIYGLAFYGRLPQTVKQTEARAASVELSSAGRASATTPLFRFLSLLPFLFSVLILVCWLFAPFLTILEKAAEEPSASAALAVGKPENGTALQAVKIYLASKVSRQTELADSLFISKSAMMLAILIFIFSVLTGLLSLRKNKLFSALLSILTASILLLSWYTDRKTATAHWGFWLMTALFLFGGFFQLWLLAQEHMIDIRYLLRTLLAVATVCIFVNGLLGTYWCTILYGKHFMVYFTPRFIKNLIQIPINTALIYYLLRAMADVPEFRRLLSESQSP